MYTKYTLRVNLFFMLFFCCCAAKSPAYMDPFEHALFSETPRHVTAAGIKSFLHQYNHLRTRSEIVYAGKDKSRDEFGQAFGYYVKEIYNKEGFADVLSQDGTHIIEFLELADEMGLSAEQVCVVVRLFYNKMKSCEIVDDTMLSQVLRRMPRLLEPYFKVTNHQHHAENESRAFSRRIEHALLMRFTMDYDRFHATPDQFLTDLSRELTDLYKRCQQDDIQSKNDQSANVERLRSIVLRLSELMLSKVWWGMYSRDGIWRSFLELENGLHQLAVRRIIDHRDDLDDVQWTLLKRFCYFLDLEAQMLPVCLFDEIENDIEQGVVQFLEMPEQDSGITTKKELLRATMLSAKTRALAYQQGVITQDVRMS